MTSLLIIHLSDIHFKEDDKDVHLRAPEIVASTQPFHAAASRILLIISGDISQSGKESQFAKAIILIEGIKSELASRTNLPMDVITCPGNHDADFDLPRSSIRSRILKQLMTEDPAKIDIESVEECVLPFRAYDDFQRKVNTLESVVHSPIWLTSTLTVENHQIEVSCVNNAWSCEKRTEPGSLGFPSSLKNSRNEHNGSVRILVMHHPAHWISSRQFREFRRLTRDCCEICITGHEHQTNFGANIDSETGHTIFIEGGALQEHGSSISRFNVVLLNLPENKIDCTPFEWQGDQYISFDKVSSQTLPEKHQAISLTPDWADFLRDIGANVTHQAKQRLELNDIYVFPEIEPADDDEKTPVVASAKSLFDKLGESESVIIKGEQKSGKTALLKQIFIALLDAGLYPIYLNGNKLKISAERDLQRLIEGCVREQYGAPYVNKILQAAPSKKFLLLDNLDAYEFPDKYFGLVFDKLRSQVRAVFATADSSFQLKEALLGEEFSSLKQINQVFLLEFGFRLRYELVKKWFNIDDATAVSNNTVDATDLLISRVVGRGLVPSYPLFLLILLQSQELGQSNGLENSALGYYYEYMILGALNSKVRHEQTHEVLNYCSQFAWFLKSGEKQRVSDREFRSFHSSFEDKFDLEINYENRKRILIEANIFLLTDDEIGFRYPYSYFFFLGRFLSRHLDNQEIIEFIDECCKNLHVRELGNAMLFLAHHSTDGTVVFDALKKSIDSRFSAVIPLAFNHDTATLDNYVDKLPALVFSKDSELAVRNNVQVQDEGLEAGLDGILVPKDFSEDDEFQRAALELLAEINGLIRGVEILGSALKANFGAIDSTTKQLLINTLFQGGLRALRSFVEIFASTPDGVMAELLEAIQDGESGSSTKATREKAVKVKMFQVIGRLSFWFIHRVGASVGSRSMTPAIDRYVATNDTVANRLIAMAGKLETPDPIPLSELRDLNSRVQKSAFAHSVLRWIVYSRIHMYRTAEREKQQICEEMGIKIDLQHAIDFKTKRTKRISN
ncbi:metallophosphoesterase [Acidovorax sp. SUPP2825]|uniref:STAND family AAA ATPase n=1 Tax=Acidovorax sp. SUPP2825 TaxID=2920879 RepID=UPI0023DE559C|nr:metallophosphoesterase [Acidovorax sp. SUPP2825]GKS97449.1 metallophosphoesterase [Acidovorax sp. SUPP2825]